MITRTTSLMRMVSAGRHMQTAGGQLAELQDQATTFRKLNRPSDDPAGTANAVAIRSSQNANEQHSRNVQDGLGWLTTLDSSLISVDSLLVRARDLTLQGANDGAMSPAAKEAIASELEAIRDSLVKEANTQYQGRSVFAGTSDAGVAFNPDYSFNGIPGSSVERRVSDQKTVRVDVDGQQVFGAGGTSVFALLDQVAADLRSGVSVTGRVTQIDVVAEGVRNAQATVGARHATVLTTQETLATKKVELESQRSDIEDIDIKEVAIQLQMQELVYQTALSVTARSTQMNLMEYLR
ncbi:flagellin N-terminal helical domain-containing protein [Agromyces humi]|uniref:flagellin N-terminal helical domain-containing protein n=1 Tax=Agromyces humi TaxID=1766800 RepID=UPI001357CC57|nr:flagellin [Agromyces humi]